jgi:D-glycero-alpha-D-manno-heptose-7-phosphate kinase
MSNNFINEYYELALKNGANGGKLIGAGGGGFLLFYTNTPNKLRKALSKKKLEEVRFKFDFEGVKQIF